MVYYIVYIYMYIHGIYMVYIMVYTYMPPLFCLSLSQILLLLLSLCVWSVFLSALPSVLSSSLCVCFAVGAVAIRSAQNSAFLHALGTGKGYSNQNQ